MTTRATFLRSKRGNVIHASYDGRITACGRRCDGFVVATDTAVTCSRCIRVEKDIEAHGN